MAVHCPTCQHSIVVKNARPGRYAPQCSKCGQTFLLTVPADPAQPMIAAPLVTIIEPPPPPPVAQPAAAPVHDTQPPDVPVADNAEFSVSPAAPEAKRTANLLGAPTNEPPDDDGEVPAVLGNYEIIRELGRGGMGTVYLARQLSLDRYVALKVMKKQWASNSAFLARFTREAYAAAQLVHHNIVQIYDIGEDQGINYFSMEYVDGQSLGDLLKKQGTFAPEVAAGYVLQAARGLKFAHDRGMIHRDIKPDNLLLNTQGVVKVADLGLVKTPGLVEPAPAALPPTEPVAGGRPLVGLSNITQADQAMGTPAYMAPEQARNATDVDYRADIYALGCTLYVMVTGRPMFAGGSALEVMTRHATEPVVRPDVVVKSVPRALSDIILKMVAKRPADRYATTDEAIRALEDFLGLQGAKKLAASEEHVAKLEQSAKAFLSSPAARLRSILLPSFFAGCGALFLLFLLVGWWRFAGSFLGLGVLTGLACFVGHGMTHRAPLFMKVRELALGSSAWDWAKVGLALLLFVLLLFLVKLLWPWLIVSALAVGLAFAMHYGLDRRIAAERAAPIEQVEGMLKGLRLRGLSEEALHEFVCKYSGDHWEELFEALFGYEAKLAARAQWGRGPRGARPRFAAWRDPLMRWIDNYRRARQEAKERKHLQAIEAKNLQAQGVAEAEARQKAERVAAVMVHQASEIKKAEAEPAPPPPPTPVTPPAAPAPAAAVPEPTRAPAAEATPTARPEPVKAKPPIPRIQRIDVQELMRMADEPAKGPGAGRWVRRLAGLVFGSTPRFLLGALMLAVGLVWMNARHLLPGAAMVDEAATWTNLWERSLGASPLAVSFVPEEALRIFCSVNAVVAGLFLLASAFWRSPTMGVFLLPAAALMAAGPVLGVPEVGPLGPHLLCLVAGSGLAVLGLLLGRDT
jgi:serine/threonine protein kinase